jgi:hypothetical protein
MDQRYRNGFENEPGVGTTRAWGGLTPEHDGGFRLGVKPDGRRQLYRKMIATISHCYLTL